MKKMKKFNISSRITMLLSFCFALVISGCKKGDFPPGALQPPRLLVKGLEELYGSTVGPDKALYVTAPLAGSIWRVDPKNGAFTLFTTGFPKRNPDPFYIGSGVVDVAFRGQTAYALVTGVAPDLGGKDVVGIYRVDGPGKFTIIGDLGAWSTAHPPVPAFFVPSGFQYAFEPYRDGFIVTDGHHNRVLYATLEGKISEIVAFGDVVPTGLAIRDNTIYLTQAGPIPHLPAQAKLISLSSKPPTVRELASAAGLEVGLFVDVEFGHGDNLYTLAQGIWDGPFEGAPAKPNTGALLKFKPGGTFDVLTNRLNQPTSMEFIGNSAYIVSLVGEVWEINNISRWPYGH